MTVRGSTRLVLLAAIWGASFLFNRITAPLLGPIAALAAADIGAAGALTVTYLIPVFGVLWGALFLGEALSAPMLAGAVLVILGTVFVLRR